MGYQYVRYEPQFRAAILGLERVLWGSDPELNSAYFAWKYERNPFSTGPVFAVALCDGKVAGVRGFHGALWDFPGEQPGMPCFCACDLVVDVAHRNKGIHKRLTEAGLGELSQLGHPLVFNFSANPANYLTSLRTGWRLVQPFDTIRRDSTMAGLARQWSSRLAGMPLVWRYAESAKRLSGNTGVRAFDGKESIAGGQLRVLSRPDVARLAGIASACRQTIGVEGKFRHVLTADYFAWRYQNPMHDYRFVIHESEPAYLVLQSRKDAPNVVVNIVDWQAASEGVLLSMVKAIAASALIPSLAVWAASMPKALRAEFAQHGFTPIDESRGAASYVPGPLVKPLRAADPGPFLQDVLNPDAWSLRMSYSDSF